MRITRKRLEERVMMEVTLPVVKAYYKPPEFRRVIPKDTRPTGEIQIL